MEPATESAFWGVVVLGGKEYKQVPKFTFRLSMAALDLETAKDSPVSLKVNVNGSNYILCNLSKQNPQAHLDLIFSEGEPITFYTTGSGSVHLTGFTMPDESLGGDFDEEFSDDESVDSEIEKLNQLANNKRKNTETLKLTGKDAKKLKTDAKPEPAKVQKVIDVDPKQLLQKKDNKAPDAQQKGKQQANQPQPKKDNKPPTDNKPAKKAPEESDDDDDDDDLSIDEDDGSVDMNKLQAMMDDDDSEVDDEDLESDDDDLESDDDEVDIAKLKQIKSGLNKSNQGPQGKPAGKAQNAGSPGAGGFQKKPQHQQQNKPHQQQQHQQNKVKNGMNLNKFGNQNKTPQQNKGQTPANKSQQKHQQTPFHKGQQNSNKKQQNSPFQHQNKSFGGSNKKPFKKAGAV